MLAWELIGDIHNGSELKKKQDKIVAEKALPQSSQSLLTHRVSQSLIKLNV